MTIDPISQHLIKIALYLDSKTPGSVSEVWLDESLTKSLKSQLPTDQTIAQSITDLHTQLNHVSDLHRRTYLQKMLHSVEYQINLGNRFVSYEDFSHNTFGIRITRVTDQELQKIDTQIQSLEKILNKTRFDILKQFTPPAKDYEFIFKDYVTKSKQEIPSYITDFPDGGFIFETTTAKPWSAFNTHYAPFKSKLTLNTDIQFNTLDLHRLAYHEAYGGHHSELSQKDKLLFNEGRGEHGLVITFSPQTFISESIAEAIFVLLEFLDQTDHAQLLAWHYDRLTFALQNLATFLFFDDKRTKEEIGYLLHKYAISDVTRQAIINFSTDPLFGKYAPVYYSAFNFLSDLYTHTPHKQDLIQSLFTQPWTPVALQQKYIH